MKTRLLIFVLVLLTVLTVASLLGRARATTVFECSVHHRTASCQSYELPNAQPQIIRVDPQVPQRTIDAVCQARVTTDELGVEHVEYMNPKCRVE